MRSIAEAAGVAQALLHYHFGTKEELFIAMFDRRSDAINRERIVKLEALLAEGDPTLEQVLEVLMRPLIVMGHAARNSFFSRLLAQETTSGDPRSQRLIERNYDGIARRFVAVLRTVLPGISETDATRGYLHVISVAMTIMAPTGRLNRLTDGRCDDADVSESLAYAVRFVAAGLRALSQRK